MKLGIAIGLATFTAMSGTAGAQTVFSTSGADAASIQWAVDGFRDELGELNAPNPGSLCEGRRQINWDAAPDAISAPNLFPGDFFNAPVFPRARGIEFTTPGTGFMLSATDASGVGIEFDNLNGGLSDIFGAFSPERLFTPLGSTTTYADFFVPGSEVPATTRGIGIVFTDVSVEGSTTIELYDVEGESLGVWVAPAHPWSESFSFLGIAFDEPIVASVKIVSGENAVDGEYLDGDLVVMDDFIFGEPVSTCPADCDANGELNILDFVCFKLAYDVQSPCTDINGDGVLNIYDFIGFQNAFVSGCGY